MDFEKLGAFYLGRRFDPVAGQASPDPLLYDSKDLTTHAVCVGMTGSGKTGLCLALLEEAGIDGIPALAIDPKGDLGNLLLGFPELRPEDFRPWVDPAQSAEEVAATWRRGLAEWGQDGARIARLRSAVDLAIYTPGSTAGLPLTLLRSFAAPSPAVAADAEALRERIAATVSGLLALLGVDADPVRSREHILLSTLLQRSWQQGHDLDLAALIQRIQDPPIQRVGVMDLESFFPAKERRELALTLNNLLASPGFAAWLEGEPLDVQRLLWTAAGQPRLTVLSIAHLSDPERMFFVTILLNEVLAWMRAQPGTPSLRALLYMDEVFGYFPPTANPPSKTPMLTLLKQARAFGLGVVLATQNPVDLDYKGLSNAGTWWLGRLQTERDKQRVLDGLEGASAAARGSFDRQALERTLSGLKSRVFLMNNVHEDEPVVFQTRWTLSYLRGPLTKTQIQTLMASRRTPPAPERPAAAPPVAGAGDRPALPPEVPQRFLAAAAAPAVYRPALYGSARLHYVQAKEGIDSWETVALLAPLDAAVADDPWKGAEILAAEPRFTDAPAEDAAFAPLPAAAARGASYDRFGKALADYLFRARSTTVWQSVEPRLVSRPGESEGEFRTRLSQLAREGRDAAVEGLRRKYAPRNAALQTKLHTAEERAAREQSQYDAQKMQTAISFGATVLGALFGRKLASVGNVSRATTAARGVGRAMREREDAGRAQESVEAVRQQLAELEAELQAETAALSGVDPAALRLAPLELRPKKGDVTVVQVALAWVPQD
ncbi:MAG TPA: hypothetical protein VJS92_09735 [Candidatus Polarisedimenticolaceae bacterium]|nr:hypothetical protein [Candidatus Polarisedimenticolaceae bacterium]